MSEKPQQVAPPQSQDRKDSGKKWKGKDWFVILAPPMFNELAVGETPATDIKGLVGRKIEVSLTELTGNPQKFYMKFLFEIIDVVGRNAKTDFAGFELLREHLMRVVRKRTSKVEALDVVKTTDGWTLQTKSLLVMNRRCEANVRRKVRHLITESLTQAANAPLEDFLKAVTDGTFQKNLRKAGSKIYPIRFCEVSKIEVMRSPRRSGKPAIAPAPQEPIEAPAELAAV